MQKESANHHGRERFDLAPGLQGVTVSSQTNDREDETQKTHSAEEDEETKNRREGRDNAVIVVKILSRS
jgi:hypothetical protein